MKPPPLLLVGDEGVVGALAAAVGCGIGGLVVAGVVRVAFAQGGRLLSVAGTASEPPVLLTSLSHFRR